MKKKLRTITIDNQQYLYSIKCTTIDSDHSILTVRIFIDKLSKHALLVNFHTLDNYYVGNPFSHGVLLYNKSTKKEEVVNLNRPYFIRLILDYGLSQGWDGKTSIEELDGLQLLSDIGYYVDKVKAKMTQKFIISYSGGKDSTLALHYAMQQGEVVGLLMVQDEDALSGAHKVSFSITEAQAKSLGLPIVSAPSNWDQYKDHFVALLNRAKAELGATTLVTGDIDLPLHNSWYDDRAEETGLQVYIPLSGKDRRAVVDEFLHLGFTSMVVRVDLNKKMTADDLGKNLTSEYLDELETRGIDPCGESGEFHTLVTNGPIFEFPIDVIKDDIICTEHHAMLALKLDNQ